jgi:hypothetical protein
MRLDGQRLLDDPQIGRQRGLPGVVVHRGVVDEHVDPPDLVPQPGAEPVDARPVGDVEPDHPDDPVPALGHRAHSPACRSW